MFLSVWIRGGGQVGEEVPKGPLSPISRRTSRTCEAPPSRSIHYNEPLWKQDEQRLGSQDTLSIDPSAGGGTGLLVRICWDWSAMENRTLGTRLVSYHDSARRVPTWERGNGCLRPEVCSILWDSLDSTSCLGLSVLLYCFAASTIKNVRGSVYLIFIGP